MMFLRLWAVWIQRGAGDRHLKDFADVVRFFPNPISPPDPLSPVLPPWCRRGPSRCTTRGCWCWRARPVSERLRPAVQGRLSPCGSRSGRMGCHLACILPQGVTPCPSTDLV